MKTIKLKSFITETNSFLDTPHDHKVANVGFDFGRSHRPGAFLYKLTKDGWFRRYENPGKGYGIMLRKFKVSGQGKPYGDKFKAYPCLFTYWPNDYKDPSDMTSFSKEDDNPKNWKSDKGFLYVANEFNVNDVINFINKQIQSNVYTP